MSVASNMMLFQVAQTTSRSNAYSSKGFALGGGQSPMPDNDPEMIVKIFCIASSIAIISMLIYICCK